MQYIDGALGGGSILRLAVPIAIATQQPLEIANIRQQRKTPGLRPQHLAGVELLAELTGSKLKGAEIGSAHLEVYPGTKKPEPSSMTISTAGSISLVYQLLSNYCTTARSSVEIAVHGGGTHTRWSPNLDYINQVTCPALTMFGQHGSVNMTRAGYYPKGGAEASISIYQETELKSVQLGPYQLPTPVDVVSRASKYLQNASVAEKQLQGMEDQGINIHNHEIIYDNTRSVGTAITAWTVLSHQIYRGFSALGKKGVPAEKIGKIVATQITDFDTPAAVDEYLADQLMLPLVHAQGGSFYTLPKLTNHVKTNLELINTMLDNPLEVQQQQGYYLIQKT